MPDDKRVVTDELTAYAIDDTAVHTGEPERSVYSYKRSADIHAGDDTVDVVEVSSIGSHDLISHDRSFPKVPVFLRHGGVDIKKEKTAAGFTAEVSGILEDEVYRSCEVLT
jgi:hypothetical protein